MKEDLEALRLAGIERAKGAPPMSQETRDVIASTFRGLRPGLPQQDTPPPRRDPMPSKTINDRYLVDGDDHGLARVYEGRESNALYCQGCDWQLRDAKGEWNEGPHAVYVANGEH